MASTDFYASAKDLIKKIRLAQDQLNKLSREFYEKKGKGDLKSGKLIYTINGEEKELSASNLNAMASEIMKDMDSIPSLYRETIKAAKAAKRAKNQANGAKHRDKPPCRYREELISFFKNASLGEGTDGSKRLQEQKVMRNFFDHQIGNLTFGVSLMNVWGYMNKLQSGNTKVVLDVNARKYLAEALASLEKSKREALAEAQKTGTEKQLKVATTDMEKFQNGEIQNKDYMRILATYRIHDTPETVLQMKAYEPVVAEMSEITRSLNRTYGERFTALHAKEKVEKIVPKTPVRRSASPPAPKTATVAAAMPPMVVPPIPVAAPPRAASPSAAPATKEKKARK
jgi:hypothetical protein